MPHSAASDLGLHCLPMSHKKEARLIWVKSQTSTHIYNARNLFVCFDALRPSQQFFSHV